jgi:hypothetical protein
MIYNNSNIYAFLTYIILVMSFGKLYVTGEHLLTSFVEPPNVMSTSRRNLVAGCRICDTRPLQSLVIRYELPSATSSLQGSKSTCVKSNYPSSTLVSVDKDGTVSVSQRSKITIQGKFLNQTVFDFRNWGKCYIDTSCDVPLVVGDKIGPFLILGGNNCTESATSAPVPTRVPTNSPRTKVPTKGGTKVPTKKRTNAPRKKTSKPIRVPTSQKLIVKPTK